jgi:hypothetical protein
VAGDPGLQLVAKEVEKGGGTPHHGRLAVGGREAAVLGRGEVPLTEGERLPDGPDPVADADDQQGWQLGHQLHDPDGIHGGTEHPVGVGHVDHGGRLGAIGRTVADEDLELIAHQRRVQVVDLGVGQRRPVVVLAHLAQASHGSERWHQAEEGTERFWSSGVIEGKVDRSGPGVRNPHGRPCTARGGCRPFRRTAR